MRRHKFWIGLAAGCGVSQAAVCDQQYWAQSAELLVLEGPRLAELTEVSRETLTPSQFNSIPKMDSINYKIPIWFTSHCIAYGPSKVASMKRGKLETFFSLDTVDMWTLFNSEVILGQLNLGAAFTLKSDSAAANVDHYLALDTTDNSISGFYAASRRVDTLIDQFGQTSGWRSISFDWSVDLDSARYVSFLTQNLGDTAAPHRNFAVQMLRVTYDSLPMIVPVSEPQTRRLSRVGPRLTSAPGRVVFTASAATVDIWRPIFIFGLDGRKLAELRPLDGNAAWDGTAQGKPVGSGLYYYQWGAASSRFLFIQP